MWRATGAADPPTVGELQHEQGFAGQAYLGGAAPDLDLLHGAGVGKGGELAGAVAAEALGVVAGVVGQ